MHPSLVLSSAVEVGGYIAWWKLIPPLLILFGWGRMLTWIDKDTITARLPRELVNTGMLAGLVLGFAFFFLLPGFFLALLVLIFFVLADAGVYLLLRNQSVGLADLSGQFSKWRAGISKPKGEAEAPPGLVTLLDRAGAVMPPPAEDNPSRAGYDAVQALLLDPLRRGAERVELTPGQAVSQVRFQVDGVPYSAPTIDRALGAAAIQLLKETAGVDVNERRKPQKGVIRASLDGKRYELEIGTAGSAAGEFMQIRIDPRARHALRLEELGLFPEQLAAVKEAVATPGGMVLVAAPRGQGLTSMLYGILRVHDAFLTNIQTIERLPDAEIEGVTQNKLPPNASGADEDKLVTWLISQQPDVIMVGQVEDPRSALDLNNFAGGEDPRRVYAGIRAGGAFEALSTWRNLIGDDGVAMRNLRLVIASRVLRRLCSACKVAYAPDPAVVRKLNMDPAKVSTLFQARTQPMRDSRGNPVLCEFCQELHFKGRIGIYEVMVVDDAMRSAVSRGGSINELRNIFRKNRGRLLQEAALAQVEAGETSVQEVRRVLSPGEAAGSGASGGSQAGTSSPVEQ